MYTYFRINQLWNYHQPCYATDSIELVLASLVDATQMRSFLFCNLTQGGKASISTALSHVTMNGCFTKTSNVNMHSNIKCTLTLESISCGTNINHVMQQTALHLAWPPWVMQHK